MADNVNVTGPVEIKDRSRERVAFDLMQYIRYAGVDKADEILDLYARCIMTGDYPHFGIEKIKAKAKGQDR